jgi:hypothetical protein
MKVKLIAIMAAILVATGVAVPMASATTASAHATTCVIPGPGGGPCPQLGFYYPSPRNVQLPTSGGYTTTVVLEEVTDYSPQPSGTVPTAFMVESKITAQRNITVTCKSGSTQIVPSDTHMNLYLNGTNTGYVPAYKSTCGDNPNFKVTLAPGKSTYIFVQFHYTPHPGNQISISQFAHSTTVFHPYGTLLRMPYYPSGVGSLNLAQLTADLTYLGNYLSSFTADITSLTFSDQATLYSALINGNVCLHTPVVTRPFTAACWSYIISIAKLWLFPGQVS